MQMKDKPDTNNKRIGFNVPSELADRLDLYCKQNFTNRTEAFKAWIKSLPVEKSTKKKKSID
jgi:metal-responsive CopG/Arc/MetJ family transcriptional regulator